MMKLVEGFDMVGKTTFMKTLFPEYKIYHCRHDLSDATIGRNNSWALGYGIIDYLDQTDGWDSKTIIDRGVMSSYVYEDIYNFRSLDSKIIEWYKNCESFISKVDHVYICHKSKETARIIYKKSQSREVNPNTISALYDKFNSFEDYWKTYCKADELYREVYDLLGIKPEVYKNCADGTWQGPDGTMWIRIGGLVK